MLVVQSLGATILNRTFSLTPDDVGMAWQRNAQLDIPTGVQCPIAVAGLSGSWNVICRAEAGTPRSTLIDTHSSSMPDVDCRVAWCKVRYGRRAGMVRATAERKRLTATGATDFDIATLRARRTNKWHKFPDDVLPAWVADMDFGVAPSIAAAMTRLTRDQEYGYAAREGVLTAAFVRRMERRFGWHTDPADTVGIGALGPAR